MELWTEIKIAVNANDIEKASDIANVVVPYGIYIEDYTNLEQTIEDIAHIDLIDEDLLKKDRNKAFVHIHGCKYLLHLLVYGIIFAYSSPLPH